MSNLVFLVMWLTSLTSQDGLRVRINPVVMFHNCSLVGTTGNHPHLFDRSEIYQCDEAKVEIAGHRTMEIENGYVYEQELGRPSCDPPHLVTILDFNEYKWCPTGKSNTLKMCGDKPTICWDGKPGTWNPEWRGYSCVTPDHK